MTDEQSRETEDEQPEVEGHRVPFGAESVRYRSQDPQDQEGPETEGHLMAFGPEKAKGPQKAG
jgi:hypothetical protein